MHHPSTDKDIMYDERALNSTLLMALSTIKGQQANPTNAAKQFLQYYSMCDSSIMLAGHHSTVSSNVCHACSHADGNFHLLDDVEFPWNNGAILTLAQKIK